jgi:hypothetical protein
VLGIGITEPPAKSLGIQGPAATLIVRCGKCGYSDVLIGYAPKRADFLKALDAIATGAWRQHLDSIEQSKLDEMCPFEQLALNLPQDDPSDKPSPPRPSVRRSMPKNAISENEVRRFLRQLHRVSMKRKTKSFQSWLRRLTG